MDITLNKVESIVLINHSEYTAICNTIVINTEKGKVNLELFGDKPLVIQFGHNEDD